MLAFVRLVDNIITLYIWVLIISAVMSWLIAFGVLNTRNRAVYMIADFAYRITEPALRPIRRVIPLMGGIDISPIILIFLLWFARDLLYEILL
jgi:YggT family protein